VTSSAPHCISPNIVSFLEGRSDKVTLRFFKTYFVVICTAETLARGTYVKGHSVNNTPKNTSQPTTVYEINIAWLWHRWEAPAAMEAAQGCRRLTIMGIDRMLEQNIGALVEDSCLRVVCSGRS
jgi:hypothetical protein